MQPSTDYPLILAINIFIRTLRRCLDKLRSKFDSIYFCIEENEEFEKFRDILKLYFPRSKEEESLSAKYLPDIKETEYGDSILPERSLNIKSNPLLTEIEQFKNMEKELTEEDAYFLEQDNEGIEKVQNYEMYNKLFSFLI